MKTPTTTQTLLTLAATLPALVALTACTTNSVDRTPGSYATSGYEEQSRYPNTTGVADHYIYYPRYQVYYDARQKRYLTLENNVWVSRPTPAGVRINELHASPGVRLHTGSSPAHHHDNMVQRYPRNWTPDNSAYGNAEYRANDQTLNRGRVYYRR